MLKRLLDLLLSALGLVLLAPLFALIALVIKLESPGPVFFRQERVGLRGKPFRIYKFRTMAVDAPGREITVGADPRITRVGAVLRRTKLDELAQLIDVFRGTMSLVGPRPEVPRYVAMYPPAQREQVLSVRPGITDFTSLHFRNEGDLLARAADPEREYVDVILPKKLQSAMNYVDHATLGHDVQVLQLTLRTVFLPRGPLRKVNDVMQDPDLWSHVDSWMSRAPVWRNLLAHTADALVVYLCWHFTYLFRLGFERWQPGRPWYDDYVVLGAVAMYLVALRLSGVRQSLWRFFGFDEFRRLSIAIAWAGVVVAVVVLMAKLVAVPRAVLLLHPLFVLLGLTLLRMVFRLTWEHAHAVATGEDRERKLAIVLGTGVAARRVIAGLHGRQGWHVLMLLDDEPAMQGMRIAGVPVMGRFDSVRDPGLTVGATHVILAAPGLMPDERERVLALARSSGLAVFSVADSEDLQPQFKVQPESAPGLAKP
jgi:lipopolysaccharide/colanic/teichoic acid biosynthesis glycosyltransferase